MLKKDDREHQMVYYQVNELSFFGVEVVFLNCTYQAGIGTYTTPQIATPMMAKVSKVGFLSKLTPINADVHSEYRCSMKR
jgi:hypothetical protein